MHCLRHQQFRRRLRCFLGSFFCTYTPEIWKTTDDELIEKKKHHRGRRRFPLKNYARFTVVLISIVHGERIYIYIIYMARAYKGNFSVAFQTKKLRVFFFRLLEYKTPVDFAQICARGSTKSSKFS